MLSGIGVWPDLAATRGVNGEKRKRGVSRGGVRTATGRALPEWAREMVQGPIRW